MPVLYALVIALLSINFTLSLPNVVNLAQTKVSAENIPNNRVLAVNNLGLQNPGQVAGIEKVNIPPKNYGLPAPVLSAASVLAEDLDTGVLLYVKDPNKMVPIASTTKLMTALVAVDYFKPNDVLTAPDVSAIPPSSMGLKTGEQLTFRSVLYGMLLNSGNDAAFTIAANYPGGLDGFVQAMNNKAQQMGLFNTHFDNPAGFDSPNHYSSAFDLAKIAAAAASNSQIARVVSTKETTVASLDKTTIHSLKNLNKLLNLPGVIGMKTGYTPEAKENLVGLIDRDNHKVLTIVLGSNDRFGETETLMNWVYTNFTWR